MIYPRIISTKYIYYLYFLYLSNCLFIYKKINDTYVTKNILFDDRLIDFHLIYQFYQFYSFFLSKKHLLLIITI